MQDKLLLGGEKLPVEKVLQLSPVYREQLCARFEAELRGNRVGVYSGDSNHPASVEDGKRNGSEIAR
jgi:hypothetical protein